MSRGALSLWALSALWHSAVCYAVPTLALAGGGFGGFGGFGGGGGGGGEGSSLLRNGLGLAGGGPHASPEGLWQTGTLGFTLVVVVVNLKLLVASRAHTFWHVAVVALSVAAYLGYLVLYSSLSPSGAVLSRISPAAAVFGVAAELAGSPAAWIALIVGTAACLLPDLVFSSVRSRRRGKRRGGGMEEGRGRGGGGAAAGDGAFVSAAGSKSGGSGGGAGGGAGGKLKAGFGESSPPPPASAGETSPAAAPAARFPAVPSSSSGRPPLHPLRSVSLQARISEIQLQRDAAAGGNSNRDSVDADGNSGTTTALARRSSAVVSSSSPSSASSSARHTGYAFDHPGFASFFADEAEREVRRTTSLSARVSGGGGGGNGGGGGSVGAAAVDGDSASVAVSSAGATAATSASGEALSSSLPDEDGGISSSAQLQIQRLSSSGRRYTATDALDLA